VINTVVSRPASILKPFPFPQRMLLPSSSSASLLSGFSLIASHFISSLVRIDEDLEMIDQFSPLKYYQGGEAVNGLELQNLLILFGLSVLFIALAWFFFVKRDLRFGGSGGVRLVLKRDVGKTKPD